MRTYKCILSVFTLGIVATVFWATAMAADLPKKGTFSGTASGYGTFQATSVGKERLLLVLGKVGVRAVDTA
jgi:hypothetical protein